MSKRPVIAVYEATTNHVITGERIKLQHVQTINGYAPGGEMFEILNSSQFKWPQYNSIMSTYDELLTYNHGTYFESMFKYLRTCAGPPG